MKQENPFERILRGIRESVTVKLLVVGILALMLLIPTALIRNVIEEREVRSESVIREISGKWGNAQSITGPFLTVPFTFRKQNGKGRAEAYTAYLHLLPEKLLVNANISPHTRHRGIYEAVLYSSHIKLSGSFTAADFAKFNIDLKDVKMDQAKICLGISDLRGIIRQVDLTINEKTLVLEPGLPTRDVCESGINAGITSAGPMNFKIDMELNGSRAFQILPLGKVTDVEIESTWADPSFTGAFLPQDYKVTDSGFSAKWQVLDMNRNYPQSWIGDRCPVENSGFGLKLYMPNDMYQKATRTAKYAILFIVLTFTVIFCSEVFNKVMIHPIQYLLIGFAVCAFYLLLVSVTEHMNFDWAYLISALAVLGLITGYAKCILKSRAMTLTIFGLLVALYGYLYGILQLEDYALLMGAVGLFVILALIMFFTRRLDWYNLRLKKSGQNNSKPHPDSGPDVHSL